MCLKPGADAPAAYQSNGDAPLSRSLSGDPKRQGGGSEALPGMRWGGRTGSWGCNTAGDQLDPSSPLSSRKIAVSFLVPRTTQQQEKSCLRTRQGPSVSQAEESAAGEAHAGEAAEGQTPKGDLLQGTPRGQVPSNPSSLTGRLSTSRAPISVGLSVQGTMDCIWIYPSIRIQSLLQPHLSSSPFIQLQSHKRTSRYFHGVQAESHLLQQYTAARGIL